MNEKVIKLINIIDAQFEVPDKTNGMNIMRTKEQILSVVNNYWPMDGNYNLAEFEEALRISDIPNFINSNNARIYLIIEK